MIVVYLLLIISFVIINYYKTKRSLHMLQQNLYNENNRYLKWVFKNKNQFFDIDIIIILIALTIMMLFYGNEFITIIGGIIISLQSSV